MLTLRQSGILRHPSQYAICTRSTFHLKTQWFGTSCPLNNVETFPLHTVENIERYRPGGYHPISIGHTFSKKRYKILHKLGSGGSSTVWLARDRAQNKLVAIKAMTAERSSDGSEASDLTVPSALQKILPSSSAIQTVEKSFYQNGPNGVHRFLVFPLAGPSIGAMRNSGRLRADLGRAIAKRTAETLLYMHRAGFAHGDLKVENILFRLAPHVLAWSDADVYNNFGVPATMHVNKLFSFSRPPGRHVPDILVAPVDVSVLGRDSYSQEDTVIIDFGESFHISKPPSVFRVAMHTVAPELRFERRTGFGVDVWALGCALFELRAGQPLFIPDRRDPGDVFRQIVMLLGRFPDSWWAAFEDRGRWFDEDGKPHRLDGSIHQPSLPFTERTLVSKITSFANSMMGKTERGTFSRVDSIKKRLRSIGVQNEVQDRIKSRMIEAAGVQMSEEEIDLLSDLLEQMLRYRPEERITMEEVVKHPWFTL